MLVVNTKEIFGQNLHQNRVHFPAERNAFVFDHQHGRRDVTCKPAVLGARRWVTREARGARARRKGDSVALFPLVQAPCASRVSQYRAAYIFLAPATL